MWTLYFAAVVTFFFLLFLSLFFLAFSQRLQNGCVPYFHTWCGLSANGIYNACLKWAARGSVKYSTQKIAKKSPSAHHRTNLSGYIFATKARIDNRRKHLDSNISSTCPRNMTNPGPLAAEIGSGVWGTQQFLTRFSSWLRYCSDVAHRRPTELCTMFGRLLGWYTIYTLSGALASWRNFVPVQNSLYVPVLRSPILPALLHGTSAAGVSQTLRHGTRNGIAELSQRAPPMFGWAAITLGIGPHSSCMSNEMCFQTLQ